MTILVDEPAPELPAIICTPAIFPFSLLSTFASLPTFMSSPSTACWAYPKDFLSRLMPKAVTTTSFNTWESSKRLITSSLFPFKGISMVWKPTYENTSVAFSASSTCSEKRPLMSVIVPFPDWPFTTTVTPGSSSLLGSRTFPVTTFLTGGAARQKAEHSNSKKQEVIRLALNNFLKLIVPIFLIFVFL